MPTVPASQSRPVMETPLSKTVRHLEHIEEYCIPEAQLALGIDPPHDPSDVVYFVSVVGFSPYRPFEPQLQGGSSPPGESEEAGETVLSWLRGGTDPAAARKKLRKMQRWEWGAIALDLPSLGEELRSRYELGDGETEFDWSATPSGVVIHCRIIPRMWRGSEHP